MTEKLILDSSIISIPVGVRSKKDPNKIIDFTLNYDMSDTAISKLGTERKTIEKQLAQIGKEYGNITEDNLNEDNFADALHMIVAKLKTLFDQDFGAGMYDKIQTAFKRFVGGGDATDYEAFECSLNFVSTPTVTPKDTTPAVTPKDATPAG